MRRAWTCLVPLVAACLLAAGCGKKDAFVYEDQFERAIGQLLGEQVAAASPGGGKVVVLLCRGTGELEEQKNVAYLAGLAEGFGDVSFELQEAGPNLTTIKPEHQAMVMKALINGWPPRAFLGWCAVDRKATAVVSFIQFPPGIRASTLSKMPPLFIFSNTGINDLRNLASQGAVRTLVIPRAGADKEAIPPKKATAREIVDLRYEIVSP